MKKITKIILPIIATIAMTATLFAGNVMALTVQEGAAAARADGMPADLVGMDGVFTRITNTVLYVVGIISVIMLVWGGLRYILSGGDSKKITDAKNTILYAIIGLIIALLAYAIVNFVLNTLGLPAAETVEKAKEESESSLLLLNLFA